MHHILVYIENSAHSTQHIADSRDTPVAIMVPCGLNDKHTISVA